MSCLDAHCLSDQFCNPAYVLFLYKSIGGVVYLSFVLHCIGLWIKPKDRFSFTPALTAAFGLSSSLALLNGIFTATSGTEYYTTCYTKGETKHLAYLPCSIWEDLTRNYETQRLFVDSILASLLMIMLSLREIIRYKGISVWRYLTLTILGSTAFAFGRYVLDSDRSVAKYISRNHVDANEDRRGVFRVFGREVVISFLDKMSIFIIGVWALNFVDHPSDAFNHKILPHYTNILNRGLTHNDMIMKFQLSLFVAYRLYQDSERDTSKGNNNNNNNKKYGYYRKRESNAAQKKDSSNTNNNNNNIINIIDGDYDYRTHVLYVLGRVTVALVAATISLQISFYSQTWSVFFSYWAIVMYQTFFWAARKNRYKKCGLKNSGNDSFVIVTLQTLSRTKLLIDTLATVTWKSKIQQEFLEISRAILEVKRVGYYDPDQYIANRFFEILSKLSKSMLPTKGNTRKFFTEIMNEIISADYVMSDLFSWHLHYDFLCNKCKFRWTRNTKERFLLCGREEEEQAEKLVESESISTTTSVTTSNPTLIQLLDETFHHQTESTCPTCSSGSVTKNRSIADLPPIGIIMVHETRPFEISATIQANSSTTPGSSLSGIIIEENSYALIKDSEKWYKFEDESVVPFEGFKQYRSSAVPSPCILIFMKN